MIKIQFRIICGISKESIYKTAIDMAKENDHPEIVELLSKRMKKKEK